MTKEIQSKSAPAFDFEGKRYDFNSLEKEARQLVNALRVADVQINRHKNTLQILEVGRQSMIGQLKEKLRKVEPLS